MDHEQMSVVHCSMLSALESVPHQPIPRAAPPNMFPRRFRNGQSSMTKMLEDLGS